MKPTAPVATKTKSRRRLRLTSDLAAAILSHIRTERLPCGHHLPVQGLADRLDVSRPPVALALQALADQGVVRHEVNRGYFVVDHTGSQTTDAEEMAPLRRIYFKIAEDRLRGALPDHVSQTTLRQTYNLTSGEFHELFSRIAREGWAERRPGYGWTFLPMLTTPQAMEHTYRVRLMLEPAGLLEPGFSLSPEKAERCRKREQAMLDGDIETLSADALYERGVQFHETLAEASGNPFLIDALRRLNVIRRLLAYRTMLDRKRYYRQVREHLAILDLVIQHRQDEAADAMRRHLQNVMTSLRAVL
jgi:DNA-binding GntR family transcriptional regulator